MIIRNIVSNRIRTPDGTVLHSRHRHDYVTYTDNNGLEYMVDGGLDYLRRTVHEDDPYTEISIFDDDPFDLIRRGFAWGTRGKDGKQPLTFTPICEMNDAWLQAAIDYNTDYGMGTSVMNRIYAREQEYRKQNNITIDDIN
jgi:hypothetical protein